MRLHGLLNHTSLGAGTTQRCCQLAEVVRRARSLPAWACCLALSVSAPQALFAAPIDSLQLPSLQPGASIDAGQWRVKPLRARLTGEHPLPRPPVQSASYLLVEVELTNLMERSSRDFAFVLRIERPALKQLGEPSYVLVRDMNLPDRLHPDMPEALMLVWPWPAGVPAPPELRLAIHAKTFKAADNLVGSPGWFNPMAIATATLPVIAK
jgi:hypothetical protein